MSMQNVSRSRFFLKIIVVFIISTFRFESIYAQEPVKFTFSTKELSSTSFEIHITAEMGYDWHIYSQDYPGTLTGTATKIRFNKHPLVSFSGKPDEIDIAETDEDKRKRRKDFYKKKVDFIQRVELKTSARTSVGGVIYYQVCTNKECLPPAALEFSVVLTPSKK